MEPGGVINQEAGATLEEVLAFIDAWDGDGPARSLDQAAQVKVVTSKSRGGHEVKRLRREAKYLELRLQQLNSCGSNETVGMLKTDAGRVQWTGAELSEYRRYQKATRTNQQLKALVAKRDQVVPCDTCSAIASGSLIRFRLSLRRKSHCCSTHSDS